MIEQLRIETVPGEPNYEFGLVAGIAESSDGSILVLDQLAQHLKVYSADGVFLRTVGRPGGGPGELGTGAGPILAGPDDTFFVPDPTNDRVIRLGPDLEPVGSSRFSMSLGFPAAWGTFPDGRIISHIRPSAIPAMSGEDTRDVVFVRGPDGAVLDTLVRLRPGTTFRLQDGVLQYRFFSPEPAWGVTTRGEFVVGHNNRYRFSVYDGSRLVRIVEKTVDPELVTEADRALIRNTMHRTLEALGQGGAELTAFIDAIGLADTFPVFHAIQGGPDGSVWVQHFQAPGELPAETTETFSERQLGSRTLGFGSGAWDVFDSFGRLLGAVGMPPAYEPLLFRGDRIYGVQVDELGVEHVLILRIVKGD